MEEDKKKSKFNIMYEQTPMFVLVYALLMIIAYVVNFSFGLPVLSVKISDWVSFATYLSGMVSPFVAVYVLFFVVRSYKLQKIEFEKASTTMQAQLKIDSLLRRQDSIRQECDRLVNLVISKIRSQANLSDIKYAKWFNSNDIFNRAQRQGITVKEVFEMSLARINRGDFVNEFPDFPEDYNYLVNLIRNIDALCDEVILIDNKLREDSLIFSTHVSEAFVISVSAQIGDLVIQFRKLRRFNTVNTDFLNNF